MLRIKPKITLSSILGTGLILAFTGFSSAQVPPPPPAPPPPVVAPPPPPPPVENSENNDNEDNRRRSSLVSCCLRYGDGIGVDCSVVQLERAIEIGDLIRRVNSDGSLYCAQGSGVVVSQMVASRGDGGGFGLLSPFQVSVQPSIWPTGPLAWIYYVLTGASGQSR